MKTSVRIAARRYLNVIKLNVEQDGSLVITHIFYPSGTDVSLPRSGV